MSQLENTTTGGIHNDLRERAPVMFRPPANPASRVYVICGPTVRDSPAWPGILADLARRAKGARLVSWADLFHDGRDYTARWPQVSAGLGGGILIPAVDRGRMLLGPVALAEARRLVNLGRPVLVRLADGRLLQWAQVMVRPVPARPGVAAELLLRGGQP